MKKYFLIILTIVICSLIVYYMYTYPSSTGEETGIPVALEETVAEIRPSTIESRLFLDKPTTLSCTLYNTGTQPLAIQHVSSSCGCTAIDWEQKRPLVKDSSMVLSIRVTPNRTGYFHKKISVFCNVENSPLMIHVKGNVENE